MNGERNSNETQKLDVNTLVYFDGRTNTVVAMRIPGDAPAPAAYLPKELEETDPTCWQCLPGDWTVEVIR